MVDRHPSLSRPCLVGKQTSSEIATPTTFPTSPAESAGVVGSDEVVRCGLPPVSLSPYTSLLEPTISQPYPLPAASPTLQTPVQENRPDLSLHFAGCALPSTRVSLPTPPIVKNAHNLRLPSFDVLGIATPHPDRFGLRSASSFSPLGAGPLSKPEDPLHALSPPLARPYQFGGIGRPSPAGSSAARAKFEYLIPIVTPPTEPGTLNWGTFVNVRTTGVGSPPSSDPGLSPSINITSASPSSPATALSTNPLSVAGLGDALWMEAWVGTVKDIITSEFQSLHVDSVKVLSHALPCPSLTGHLFGQIIAGIHEKTTTPTAWINVFHAVPGRFTLSDLPKSPPSTPGPAVGGEDYFTSKVFDSAVAVPDYQLDSKLLSPSPRPVVPPGSVHVSVVERYIPPTNVNEFAEMFQVKGRSLLCDRLVELSADNGQLLFIYPTKTGAKTFMHDYLGPILDPLLRSITVVHDLSSDLGKSLGQMVAVDHLAEYETLNREVERFCRRLSDGTSFSKSSAEQPATYNIVHASKEEIVLERNAWASDWWIKQEKPRVREVVTRIFRKKIPSSDMTPTNLIQEILDGVAHREYQDSISPQGVEVGVFIIKKTF